ncbi:MAG: twin-arginine translocation signal domain-containing protein, partial [Atopobiaceae bacterium]
MAGSNVTRRSFVKGGLAAGAIAALAGCGKKSDSS